MRTKTIIFYTFLLILPITIFVELHFFCNFINDIYKILIILGSVLLSILSLVFYKFQKISFYRFCFVINIIMNVVFVVLCVMYYFNLGYIFSSINNLKQFILSTKSFGMLVFVAIQISQVLLVPIPAAIITIAGAAIWGPLVGGLLDSLGVLIGSIISFFVGKIFGKKVVSYVVGDKTANKYAQILNERGKFFLIYAFLLPLFPDDILCLIAGMTTMQFRHFFLIALITRPIGVMFMSYFGTGAIIPFSGWGIIAWIIILISALCSVFILTKYQTQIEAYILNKLMPKRKKLQTKKTD